MNQAGDRKAPRVTNSTDSDAAGVSLTFIPEQRETTPLNSGMPVVDPPTRAGRLQSSSTFSMRNSESFQQSQILIPKASFLMMLLLIQNVTNHRSDL